MTEGYLHRDSEARFLADVETHELVVAHDDGLYRHLRFRRPDTGMYWFDLVTWPGSLVINSDMGSYTFSRVVDMFEFFGSNHGYINPGYWGEKLQNNGNFRVYSEDRFRQVVTEYVEGATTDWPHGPMRRLFDYLRAEVLDDFDGREQWEDGARELLREFNFVDISAEGKFKLDFADSWEWDFKDYKFHYLWCCHAIRWGIDQYRKAKSAT